MAVTYVKGNSPLGSLGSLGIAVGTLTGQPWLTALGTGMSAANSMINGNGNSAAQSIGAFQDALKGILGWTNPAHGNIAKSAPTIADFANRVAGKSYRGLIH